MPDREVKTIRDLLFYQYAKLVARSAFKLPDGVAVKREHYGFVKTVFRDLRDGRRQWSDILREDWQLMQTGWVCLYCGAGGDLAREHTVPSSLRVNDRCAACDTIQGIHNQALACRPCNSSKGTKGLYTFFRQKFPADRKFYDRIPSLLEKKYLKTVHECLSCVGCMGRGDMDGDGELTVLDIDFALAGFVQRG